MDASRPIPLFSPAAVNDPTVLGAAVQRVLASQWFILGREVAQFEAEFASYIGVRHCVSVANGTDALELALRAAGVRPGDRVACVANAGYYASTAIDAVGAQPVYVDVDDASLTMSADGLAAALALRPAAVIVTHLYGQLADMAPIVAACRRAGVRLIEDCAQAHGARSGATLAGAFGDIACFSFYPTKNLGAVGDGGAVVTDTEELAVRLKALRQYGWSRKYEVSVPGGRNSRLDEIQAAVLRAKLPQLDAQNAQRRAVAARYNQAFAGLPLQLPVSVGDDYVAHLYVVRSRQREALRAHLSAAGISSEVHYPIADTRQPAHVAREGQPALPVTEAACASALTLPCFPGLGDADVERVIAAVRQFHAEG
jgi:aminotransferase EvaB